MKSKILHIVSVFSLLLIPAFAYSAKLELSSSVDHLKDVLDEYKELPSDLFKAGEVKSFLSKKSAKEMRAELALFRNQMIEKYKAESKKEKPDYFSLSKEISKKYKEWIKLNVKKALPPDINVEDFALVAFGSLARDE